LHGTPGEFEGALRVALEETRGYETEIAAAHSKARAAVATELDGSRDRLNELGPYFGFLGSIVADDDPRRAPVSITRLENLAACPWQMFLHQILRIRALPDAHVSLPSVDPLLMGQLVHHTLEEIAAEQLPETDEPLSVVAQRSPTTLPWPEAAALRKMLNQRAKTLLLEAGISTPGFETLLVDRALEFMEVARLNQWPGPGSEASILGVEVNGSAIVQDLSGAAREIFFRADRVDVVDGHLRLVDYKTGKPVSELKRESSRSDALRKEMARGKWLQAAVYAAGAAQCTEAGAVGQYLNLSPHTAEDARIAEVDFEGDDFIEIFESTAATVFDALDHGSFIPRLIEPSSGNEPRRCQYCDVKEACRRGDSGARRALEEWADAAKESEAAPASDTDPAGETKETRSNAQQAALRIWNLGVPKP
jgi:RecB family exonuclease